MKKIYLIIGCVLSAMLADAQLPTLISDNLRVKRCATVEVINAERRNNPNYETDAHFEAWIANAIEQRRAASGTNRVPVLNYNLPVVFHIVSNGESTGTGNNVAQGVLTQQMLQLNKDFANQSNSMYGVAANSGIKFSFAQKDPNGNILTEPGIDRIDRNTYGWTDPAAGWSTSYVTSNIKPLTIWDPTRYINVWLVPFMPTTGGEILGFATFPVSSGLVGLGAGESDSNAGVVIKATVAGSVFAPFACNVAYGQGRTLSHELGHFFGLRHIWGDGNCATDFVDDTPVHQDANSGVPMHPKPNSCGTPDEMFENYMDYSNDNILNTFTALQVDRMQTVMLNSPRRKSLPSSSAGFIAASATNRISFNECSGNISVSELGVAGTYPRYRNVNVYLNVDDKATGAATVNFIAGGSAVANLDYELPAPVNFAAGENTKPISIRILDDAAVDGNKTLTLTYSITGTGVTAGTSAQSFTINIQDDDNFVTSNLPVRVISEGFEGALPGWGVLASSGSPNSFTISANGDAGGSGLAAHITNNTTTRPNSYTKTVDALAVLRTPLINASALKNIRVGFKYRVHGESDADGVYDYAKLTYSTPAAGTSFLDVNASGAGPYVGLASPVTSVASVTLPASFNFSQFYLGFFWENDASAGNDPGFNLDDLSITGEGFSVETAVSSSYAFDVPAATVNNFRSINDKSIAQLAAVNANLTNVKVAVTEAGNDRVSFTGTSGSYMRTRKVISVSPNPNNTTAQYTVKLYYSAAELAAWGGSVSTLKIMKVNSGVDLFGQLNTNNAVIVTPSLFQDSSASKGYYAFTATFTGFSQFVLVDATAVLPIKLLSFTGTPDKDRVRLNWKTSLEVNNKGFDIERSTDGVSFETIGFTAASSTFNYESYDAGVSKGNTYYYRLKQIDLDGNFSYSPIVSVRFDGANSFVVFPNPIKNKLEIRQSGTGRTHVVVTDLAGKTVYRNSFTTGSLPIDAQAWSKGIYMVRVFQNDEVSTFKVIKQ